MRMLYAWSGIYDYDGNETASPDIPESAFIRQISFIDTRRLEVTIYDDTRDEYSVIIDL